jgi:hypothetical protein
LAELANEGYKSPGLSLQRMLRPVAITSESHRANSIEVVPKPEVRNHRKKYEFPHVIFVANRLVDHPEAADWLDREESTDESKNEVVCGKPFPQHHPEPEPGRKRERSDPENLFHLNFLSPNRTSGPNL